MLALTKKTEYALIALGCLAQSSSQMSARQIASQWHLPVALVMNIMKVLHQNRWLSSTRGARGGYRLARDLSSVSLFDLVQVLEGPVFLAQCVEESADAPCACRLEAGCPIQNPIRQLHGRLEQFLKDVKLTDILSSPGIDVPRQLVGVSGV